MPISRNRKRIVKITSGKDGEIFVPNNRVINTLEWWVRLAQPIPLILMIIRFYFFTRKPGWVGDVVFTGGVAFMLFSQMRIMFTTWFTNKRRLFTGDVFKYTRHPMYTGLVIADLSLWPGNILRPNFLENTILLYIALIFVSWLHEQEILAKFGPAAEKYYARTPRLFFMYPFMKKN